MRASSCPVCSSGLTSSQYLIRMMPDFDKGLFDFRRHFEKALDCVHRAEFHDPLDAGAVVPATIEDDDLASGRQMPHVALDVHLRLFAFGRRGQRDHTIDARD